MLTVNTSVKFCKNSQAISRTVYERTKKVPKFVQPPENNIPKQLNPIHLYYSETLTRLTDSKDFDAIWASWDKFRKIHKGGDVVVWNQMLNVCLLTGNVEKGILLFNDMQKVGIQYDDCSARTVIILMLSNGYYDQGIFLVNDVIEKKDKKFLTPPFWNIIIRFFVRSGKLKLLKLSTNHYLSLCQCIIQSGQLNDLQPLMEQFSTKKQGSKGTKKLLFDTVLNSISVLLEVETEFNKWKKIMINCGYGYPFPNESDINIERFKE